VSVRVPGHDPILLDLGTGLRYFGMTCPVDEPFRGTCLLSHMHWDHIQGLPFFTPLLRPGAELDVYAPAPGNGDTVAEVMSRSITPPLFPVGLDVLPGVTRFHDIDDSEFSIGDDVQVMSRLIPHVGRTCGYRLTWNGVSIAYLSDHQQPSDGSFSATPNALELCRDADLLIHDAQYTPQEFSERSDWGHCMVDYAVWLAATSGVRTLALFHHDPGHHDDLIDVLAESAAACGRSQGLEVIAAREGLAIDLAR
jgi:phosphoribosyl 1,2-cyclic phosphodiesterase